MSQSQTRTRLLPFFSHLIFVFATGLVPVASSSPVGLSDSGLKALASQPDAVLVDLGYIHVSSADLEAVTRRHATIWSVNTSS